MPELFTQPGWMQLSEQERAVLDTYLRECDRGLVHTQEWQARMAQLMRLAGRA